MDRAGKLTALQRETLRLVGEGYQSKEIARQHGVTPDAIDARIKAACRILDVSSRKEAARLVRLHAEATYQPLVSQPKELPSPAPPAANEFAAVERLPQLQLREEVKAYDPAGLEDAVAWTLRLTDATRPKNRLNRRARFIIILLMAVVFVGVGWGLIAGTLAGVDALNKRFGRVPQHATTS